MHSFLTLIIPIFVALNSCCAHVLPLKHQFAHDLFKQAAFRHQHFYPQPEETRNSTIISKISSGLSELKPINQDSSKHARTGSTATIAFEAVPIYPETGAEENRLVVPLKNDDTFELVAINRLSYSVRLEEAVIWNGETKIILPGIDDIVCRMSLEQEGVSSGAQLKAGTTALSFGRADGMVFLPQSMRDGLRDRGALSKISCSVTQSEL